MAISKRQIDGPALLISSALILIAFAGCSDDGGDTTIVNTTTVIEEGTSGSRGAQPDSKREEEFSGPCSASRDATATRTGFDDIIAGETSCEFASEVAGRFADAYGPGCIQGCTKVIEGLRCETQPPVHSEVECFAARTEVRFSISGPTRPTSPGAAAPQKSRG